MTASTPYAQPPAPAIDPDAIRIADVRFERPDGSVVMVPAYLLPDGEGDEGETLTFEDGPVAFGGLA